MSRLIKGSRRWLGPMVLTGVVLVLLLLVRAAPSRWAEEPAPSPLSPLPTPTPGAEVVITPTAVFEEATPTPWPTFTPRPTPTRRPGPTATPFPTRGPAPDPSGMILYLSAEQGTVMGIPIDGEGRKAGEVAPLPLSLDFVPVLEPPSPDGRYLLLRRPVEPAGIPYVFDRKTQELWPVFKMHPRIGRSLGWHPDSLQVLFGEDDFGLWLVNVETGAFTVLAFTDRPRQGGGISPDGQEVVYIGGIVREGKWHEAMWKVSSAGSDARLLFEMAEPSYVFGWSPDGAYLLYAGRAVLDPPAEARLWLMDPEGQNRRPLPGPVLFGWGFQPVWSPDGQWIAFTGLEENQTYGCLRKAKNEPEPDPATCRFKGTAVYIIHVQTGEIRRLTSGIAPVWSPDGKMIAFLSDQNGFGEIWTIYLDGSNLQQITSSFDTKWQFIWITAYKE